MRHSSESALSASVGGVCDSPASSTIVQRVEVNRPWHVVSVGVVTGMRRFYSHGGKKASQQPPTDGPILPADVSVQLISLTPAFKPVQPRRNDYSRFNGLVLHASNEAIETALTSAVVAHRPKGRS